jgi:DNA repair protein RadC
MAPRLYASRANGGIRRQAPADPPDEVRIAWVGGARAAARGLLTPSFMTNTLPPPRPYPEETSRTPPPRGARGAAARGRAHAPESLCEALRHARQAPIPAAEEAPILEGPRERVVRGGPRHLEDDELLAVLIGTGCAKEPVGRLAARLLAESSGLVGLAQLSPPLLARTRGIGPTKAARIAAALELGRRVAQAAPPPTRLRSAEDVDALLRSRLAHLEVEHFLALALDARHRVVRELWVSKGTMTACIVSVADVYRQLLREAAPAVIFVHNHPSGEAEPSQDDVLLTERLVSAGELLGVRVIDHVIIAREGHRSLRDLGLMPAPRC